MINNMHKNKADFPAKFITMHKQHHSPAISQHPGAGEKGHAPTFPSHSRELWLCGRGAWWYNLQV